jgi:hypothetical protein
VFLRVELVGKLPAADLDVEDVELTIPIGKIQTVVNLLREIVAQTQREGVLPS